MKWKCRTINRVLQEECGKSLWCDFQSRVLEGFGVCIDSILMDKLPEFAAIWLDSSLSIIYVRWVDALDVENNNLGFKIAIDFYPKKNCN